MSETSEVTIESHEGSEASCAVTPTQPVIGIVSFSASLVVALLMFLVFAIGGYIDVVTPGGLEAAIGAAYLVGMSIIGLLFINVAPLALGVVGLTVKNAKRELSVAGIVISGTTCVVTMTLIIIGNIA